MAKYLLSIYQPEGEPDSQTMARIAADLHAFNEDLRENGSWVFTGGLHAANTATVVRPDGLLTDGPYVEGKEHVGGIWVIEASDLDSALAWGRRAARATTLPIEVRPFQEVAPY